MIWSGTFKTPVNFVWGAPCSGKSTFVLENASWGDLIIDLDRIIQSIGKFQDHEKSDSIMPFAFDVRDLLINKIIQSGYHGGISWIVACAPRREQREKILKAGAQSIFMDKTINDCKKNLRADTNRKTNIQLYDKVIDQWFKDFEK